MSTKFRPIHYLGSKLKILDFIKDVIDDIDPTSSKVCDLFSGSGSVSMYLSKHRPVVSVDIQKYSCIISEAVLNPSIFNKKDIDNFINKCKNSKYFKELKNALSPITNYEKKCIELALDNNLEPLCEFLEKGFIIKFEKSTNFISSNSLKDKLLETTELLKNKNLTSKCLISEYFGGIYFSYEQCTSMDAILENISTLDSKIKEETLLSALLSTASEIVNTVGNQFAQPMQPRKSDGTPKNIVNKVNKDRSKDVFEVFSYWLKKYQQLEQSSFKHEVKHNDFLKALDELDSTTKVVYADPPYTRDHYSRFYHVLETICLKDFPEISTTKINGKEDLSRALYREDRHQSPFCIKSKAPIAFEEMFKKIANINASLVLSYSPFDESMKSHPRVMTIDKIKELGSKYFNTIYSECPGEFQHSKFNHKEKNFDKKTHGEILIIFKNKKS